MRSDLPGAPSPLRPARPLLRRLGQAARFPGDLAGSAALALMLDPTTTPLATATSGRPLSGRSDDVAVVPKSTRAPLHARHPAELGL